MFFVLQGQVVVGYEVNKIKKFCLKLSKSIIIGDFGMTFNMRSEFIYTAFTDLHTLAIRKEKWIELLTEHIDLGQKMISKISLTYITKIKSRVLVSKRKAVAEMNKRKDHNMI
jgi:CRP-like cAMP-binding protein